jgi:hypothetical protein
MDVNKLLNALENENNDSIMSFTTKKINELNFNVIKELHLPKQTALEYLKKLKGYRYIDEINDLKHGAFIRWIPITDPDYLPLHNCAMICEIKITDRGVIVMCKNFMHRHYTFKMDECLLFQKLTNQELVLISALDHLENSKDEDGQDDEDEQDETN